MRQGIAVLVVAMAAGCGGPAPESAGTSAAPAATASAAPGTVAPLPAAAEAGGDACRFVTEAEASEIMGHAMTRAAEQKPMDCQMVSASGDATKAVNFQVLPGTQLYDQGAKGLPEVPGVGEKAVAMGGGNVILAVAKGRTFMGGVYDGQNLAAGKDRSIALAKKAVARM